MGRKPKICFLGMENLPVLAPGFETHRVGGEQVQQSLLAKAFVRWGYDVSMVTGDYGQLDGQTWEGVKVFKSYGAREGLPVIRFVYPRWVKTWMALRRADADVYYTSCAGMQVGLLAMFCQRHKRRFVFRIASDRDCDPQRLLIRLRRDRWLYEYGLRRADVVLAQSEQQTEALRSNFGMASVIAGMLVDNPDGYRTFAERDIDVLWVNNLQTFKRPDLLLDLALRMPEASFHMIGGPNDPRLYEQIKRQAQTIPNLDFHGPVPYRQVGEYYDRCRVFVNTSDFEGFPNSYLQAWVRGVPVVAFFDMDGLIEKEGLGRSAVSMSVMTESVRRLLTDTSAWSQTGKIGRASCRERV